LILRIAIGAVFMYHGWGKLQGLEGVAMFFGKIGIAAPSLMAPVIAYLELIGGGLILLGLGTRAIAFLLACTMVVAIFQAKGLSAWSKIEFEVALLAINLSLMFSGAGAYSLDALLMKKGIVEHDSSLPMAKA
jgi:putative oxidoreductase